MFWLGLGMSRWLTRLSIPLIREFRLLIFLEIRCAGGRAIQNVTDCNRVLLPSKRVSCVIEAVAVACAGNAFFPPARPDATNWFLRKKV
jgi:hypothetical protein